MPGGMEVDRVEGTLTDGLLLSGVTLRPGSDRLTIERLALSLSASSLLARAAIVDRAEMSNVVYTAAAPGDIGVRGEFAVPGDSGISGSSGDSTGFNDTSDSGGVAGSAADVAIPVPLVVRSAAIDTVTLHAGVEPLVFDRIELSGRWVGSRIVVEDVRADSGSIALTGGADVLFENPVRLSADINWAGGRGSDRAAGYLQVSGALPSLALRHQLALPLEAVVGGAAEIRRRDGETMLEAGALSVETNGEELSAAGRLSLATTEWQLALERAGDGATQALGGGQSEGGTSLEGRLLPSFRWSLPAGDGGLQDFPP
jgi:hypothetical protein